MKIKSILPERRLITEGWHDPRMLLLEQRVINPWVKDIERYIVEAQLTTDQVKQIFAATEKAAIAGGGSRTLAGKGVDAAKFIDKKINELGAALKNTGPVKNMDAKFAQLKTDITANNPDNKLVQGIKAVSDWAKANPAKASIAVAVLTAAASFAGGPFGGLVGGFLARALKDLLQGADLSTAVGQSIKTGVYGFLAGLAFKYVTDNILDNIASASDADLAAMEQSFKEANFQDFADLEYAKAGLEVGALDGAQKIALQGNLNAFNYSYDTVLNPQQLGQFNALNAAADAAKSFSPDHYAAAAKLHDFMIGVQNSAENIRLTGLWNGLSTIPQNMLYDDQIVSILTQFDSSQALIGALGKASDVVASAIQGAVQAADDKAKSAVTAKPVDAAVKKELEADAKANKGPQESYYVQSRPLSEGQVYLLLNKITQQQALTEGPMDLIKKGAGAAIGAVGKGLSFVGKQTTEKVTSAKLFLAWKAEGSPTDSEALRKFLTNYGGITPEVIDTVYTQMKLPAAGQAAAVDIETVKQMLDKLPVDGKVKLLKYLTKQPAAV